jgi:hypothetical protein
MEADHIEIKASKELRKATAQKIVDKGSIFGVITTGKIVPSAKKLFDAAAIDYAENVPEDEVRNYKNKGKS